MSILRKILFTLLILLSVNVCYSQKKQVKNTQNSTESAFNREFSYFFLNGNKYKNFGDYQTAIKYYTQALSSDPTQASAYYEIASILVITGDYSSAVAYAEKAVQYDKTNNEAYLGLLVYAYKFNNQIEKTIPLFKKYIAQNPDEISNYFDLARIYSDVNKPKDAIKTMNSAEQRFGVLSTIIYEKFVIYEKHNDIDKAIAELERLRDAFPQDVRNKVMLANVYLQYKRMPEAEKEFKELEKMPINEGIVFLTLADYHRMVDYQYFTYFTYLEKAFLCEDESLGYEYKLDILNKLLEAAKKDDYVRAQLKYLVSIFERQYPGEIAVCAIKADIAMIDNDLKSVQKNLIELVASEKSSYEVWQHLMSLDYHLQDFDNLYAHSKEVVELFPNILEAYQYFTVAAYLKSSFVEVVESVETAFLLAIDDQQVMVDLLSMQGDAYHALHKYEQSDSVYDYVLYKDAEYISVLNSYSYSLSERGERLDYALELSSRLMKLASDNPSYIDTHAWALYKNGKFEEALEYINKAISIMGDYSVFYDHRGDILYSLKRVDEAVVDWQKALELDPENESLPLKIKNKTIGN